MLQRIQSAPSEGDALFNLATLTNGWRAILLSPLYGGIFAFLLFILFAGGIINGSVFPSIATSAKVTAAQLAATPTPTPAGTEARPVTAVASPTPATATSARQSTNTSSVAQSSPTATPIQSDAQRTDKPVPSPTPGRSAVLQIKDFLRETGPTSGIAYALLIIWSFLAGFAERLVPDTLNRLVQKNIDIGGKG